MKLRLYIVSVMAIRIVDEMEGAKPHALTNHFPGFVLARSIDEAGQNAKNLAFDMYPPADGWSMQSAMVSPAEPDFFETIDSIASSGALAIDRGPDDETRLFNYDADTTTLEEFDGQAN